MPRTVRLAALALCLIVTLALTGCGGDEESTGTQATGASKAQADRDSRQPAAKANAPRDGGKHRGGADSKQAKAPKKAPGSGKERAAAKSKKTRKVLADDPPANLSDEEVCEREPSSCGPDEDTPPDYSNPDVRRAEERAEEPDEPVKCDSSDCERLRREGR